jgi:hypothetical protein
VTIYCNERKYNTDIFIHSFTVFVIYQTKKIIGRITSGLLVQYYALGNNNDRSKFSNYPSWYTNFGPTLNDILTGVFLFIGIENIRLNPNFKPLVSIGLIHF